MSGVSFSPAAKSADDGDSNQNIEEKEEKDLKKLIQRKKSSKRKHIIKQKVVNYENYIPKQDAEVLARQIEERINQQFKGFACMKTQIDFTDLMTSSPDPLKKPLVAKVPPELHSQSKELFELINHYMGLGRGNQQQRSTNARPIETAKKLLTICFKQNVLRDECY